MFSSYSMLYSCMALGLLCEESVTNCFFQSAPCSLSICLSLASVEIRHSESKLCNKLHLDQAHLGSDHGGVFVSCSLISTLKLVAHSL